MFLSFLAITAAPVPTVVQKNHTMCVGPEVRSFSSVDDNTYLLAGAEQEGPAHNPWSTHGPHPVGGSDPPQRLHHIRGPPPGSDVRLLR